MLIRYSTFLQGVKYVTSTAQGFFLCRVSVATILPRSRATRTVAALRSRRTAASLVCDDQWPWPKSLVSRSAAATRKSAMADASAAVALPKRKQ